MQQGSCTDLQLATYAVSNGSGLLALAALVAETQGLEEEETDMLLRDRSLPPGEYRREGSTWCFMSA